MNIAIIPTLSERYLCELGWRRIRFTRFNRMGRGQRKYHGQDSYSLFECRCSGYWALVLSQLYSFPWICSKTGIHSSNWSQLWQTSFWSMDWSVSTNSLLLLVLEGSSHMIIDIRIWDRQSFSSNRGHRRPNDTRRRHRRIPCPLKRCQNDPKML